MKANISCKYPWRLEPMYNDKRHKVFLLYSGKKPYMKYFENYYKILKPSSKFIAWV